MTEEKVLYEGIAVGGPFDGRQVESRFPKGFICADPAGGRVWVYDYNDSTDQFIAREVDKLDRNKAMKAALSDTYDVRAYDDGQLPLDLEVGL